MTFLADECLPLPTRKFLQAAGYRLVTVEQLGRSSAPNGELLTLARHQRLVLVTVDRGLGNMKTFPLGTHHGIAVLKIPRFPEDLAAVHRHLRDALSTTLTHQLAGSLLIIDRNKYRLRRPPA